MKLNFLARCCPSYEGAHATRLLEASCIARLKWGRCAIGTFRSACRTEDASGHSARQGCLGKANIQPIVLVKLHSWEPIPKGAAAGFAQRLAVKSTNGHPRLSRVGDAGVP